MTIPAADNTGSRAPERTAGNRGDFTDTGQGGFATAELVARLGRLSLAQHDDADGETLTPAQWNALRYFARANRFSRTVSAFAEFHASTRGTASQTINTLVRQGFLHRQRCRQDGRSRQLELTEQGRRRLAADPLASLAAAVDGLQHDSRAALHRILQHLLSAVADGGGRARFGPCRDCRHLCEGYCALVDEPLRPEELSQTCVNFQAIEQR